MSELTVGTLSGLAANSYVIDVASGSQLTQPGMVLQVVSTTKTDTFSTASTSLTDVTGLSVTITPTSTSSKILVMASVAMSQQDGYIAWVQLFRDSTAIYLGDVSGSRTRASAVRGRQDTSSDIDITTNSFTHLDSPATTSAITYKIQGKSESGGTLFVNRSYSTTDNAVRSSLASSITVMEIAG